MESNLNPIPDKVEKTEQSLVWFIQNVLRGGWFRRFVFLSVIFTGLASPAVISSAISFFAMPLPHWYTGFYWAVVGLLLMTTLIVGIRTIPRPPNTATTNVATHAIRGLLPFNLEDSGLFAQLERGVELQRVLASLLDPGFRFGILVGPSGSGKTSFLRAGLLAQLSEKKVSAAYIELSNEDPTISISREVARQGDCESARVLLLDQFEQFFLHQRTDEQRSPLIKALGDWYRRDSGIRVLVSIRAEDAWQMIEVQECLDYQLSNQNYFKLPKFSLDQAVEVLRVLCDKAGIVFDPVFARRIVDQELRDPEDGLVSPVNLGIVILVLATSRQALTQESFKAHGGIQDLLESWLNSQLEAAKYQGLDNAAIRTLTALCDFGHNRRAGILTVDNISSHLGTDLTHNQIERAIQWLTSPNVRLAVRVGEKGSVGYQLSHERLIPAIRKTAGKLLDEAARANELLNRRVSEWVNNKRSSRFLLPLFEYWQVEHQRPYVIWGETRADKEDLLKKSRRRWQQRAALLAVGVIVLLASYAAWSSNPVQRRYIRWELDRIAQSYPSVDVALAFAATGDLRRAQDIVHKPLEEYTDDIVDEYKSLGQVAVEAAKTGLARQDEALLQQSLEIVKALDPDFQSNPLGGIAVEMARAGRFDQAVALANPLSSEDNPIVVETGDPEFQSSSLGWVAVEMAKAGRFDEAEKLTKTLASEDNSDLSQQITVILQRIAIEMAKAGQFDQAEALAKRLGNKEANTGTHKEDRCRNKGYSTLALVAVEMAKAGLSRRNESLMKRAQVIAKTLDDCAMGKIAVEMAALGRATKNQRLLTEAQTLVNLPNWSGESIERWKIAVMVGNGSEAKTLFNEAYQDLGRPQGPSVVDDVRRLPEEMAELGLAIKDQELLEQARQAVHSIGLSFRPEALRNIARKVAKSGDTVQSKELLEEAWQEAQNVRSDEYYSAFQGIAADLAKLGYLKRAREIAESVSGIRKARALAGIVLADIEISRSSQPQKLKK